MLKPSAQRLRKLDRFLSHPEHGDDVMLLSELDGFIAGLVVSPDLILPGEWLPLVWGGDAPVFRNEREANEILGLFTAHYNDVIRRLGVPGHYAPVYLEDTDGSALWELWATGFARAIALRPDAWLALRICEDEAVRGATAALARLSELADCTSDQWDDHDKALIADAADLIPECVELLHAHRLATQAARDPTGVTATRRSSVGRNDPRPCGSGKKFTSCCLR
ncbi:MAG: UPF0149 family protein [Rhodospirillaceae bacterium]|nr:UPF0149 family protein [Rhodospirillaceae bacterium]